MAVEATIASTLRCRYRFNGHNWWLAKRTVDGFEGDGGLVFGEIHVVADDRIEYIVAGRVVAVYAPRDEEFPGCD